jgi:hypothetical protein
MIQISIEQLQELTIRQIREMTEQLKHFPESEFKQREIIQNGYN